LTAFSLLKLKRCWSCERCGECCRNVFGKRFGAGVTSQEKQRLEVLARKRGVNVHFAPLARNIAGLITLFQFADQVCPFLDKARNSCKIYEYRPLLCWAYPLMPYGVGECSGFRHLKDHFTVVYPELQVAMGQEYIQKVAPLFTGAFSFYSMNTGQWSLRLHGV